MAVLLNVIAWNSTAFCDAYIMYIFPIWVNTYGRFTGLFPFSVGEWMLVAGVMLVLLAVIIGFLRLGICLITALKKGNGSSEKIFTGAKRWIRVFYLSFAWILLGVCVIMTLNCFILYHASTFSQKYFGEDTREYTLVELIEVYNHVVVQCNRLSGEVERDASGAIVYRGMNAEGEAVSMEEKAIAAMQQLGKKYPQLDGYYPRPKPMFFSDFMCQQYMCGYYFPFSMEANYNDVMYIMNKPATMCHELAHLRGYIYEDEANFIGYLACVGSDDVTFQYAGYLSVLAYLSNDIYHAKQTEPELYGAALCNVQPLSIVSVVYEDITFVTEQEWERIEEEAWLDTETVDEVSDSFTDATLKLNGVSDGMLSYNRVVALLLQYYIGEGMLQEG